MKDLSSSTYTVILLLVAMMVFSGCTILGLVMADSHNKARASETYSTSNFEQWEMINKDNLVEIHAIDGRVLEGYFQGIETVGYLDLILLKRKDIILKIRSTDIEKIQVIGQKKNGWIIMITGIAIDGFIYWRLRNNWGIWD